MRLQVVRRTIRVRAGGRKIRRWSVSASRKGRGEARQREVLQRRRGLERAARSVRAPTKTRQAGSRSGRRED